MQCATKKVGRYREGAETRQRILDTALDLIAGNGYSATSIAKISTAAGVQPASIYWAFGSKESLLAAVMERAAERWFATELKPTPTDGPADMEKALQRWTASISARPGFLRLLLVLSLEPPWSVGTATRRSLRLLSGFASRRGTHWSADLNNLFLSKIMRAAEPTHASPLI